MNKVLLIGRISKKIEVNITNNGIKYARITLAIPRIGSEEKTDFIPIVAWRQTAEFIEKYLAKGSLVSLEGKFVSNSFEDKEGKRVFTHEVLCDRIQPLETKSVNQNRKEAELLSNSNFKKENFENINNNNVNVQKENKLNNNIDENKKEKSEDIPWEMEL